MFFKTFLNFTRWIAWPIIPGFIIISTGSAIPQISLADIARNFYHNNSIMSELELQTCRNNALAVIDSLQKEIEVYKKSTPKSQYQIAEDIASQIKKEYSKDYLSQLSRGEIRQLVSNHPLILELQGNGDGNFKKTLCKKIVEAIIEIVVLLIVFYVLSKLLKALRKWLHFCDYVLNPEEFLNLAEIESCYSDNFDPNKYQEFLSTLSNAELERELDLIKKMKGVYYRGNVKGCADCVKKAIDNINIKKDQIEIEFYYRENIPAETDEVSVGIGDELVFQN